MNESSGDTISPITTQSNSHESTEHKDNIYKAAPYIYRPDGWLAQRGLFWGCKPDEHDPCATYVLKTQNSDIYKAIETGTQDETHSTVRRALFEEGYAHLSHNKLFLPTRSLSDKQIELLTKAQIQIPVLVDSVILEKDLTGLKAKLESRDISNDDRNLLNQFFLNNWRFRVDDDPSSADRLFALLTEGMKDGGYQQDSHNTIYHRYPDSKEFVMTLEHHQHDGGTVGVGQESNIYTYDYKGPMGKYIDEYEKGLYS